MCFCNSGSLGSRSGKLILDLVGQCNFRVSLVYAYSFFRVNPMPQRSSSGSGSGSRRVVFVLFVTVLFGSVVWFCTWSVDIFEFLLRKKLRLNELYTI